MPDIRRKTLKPPQVLAASRELIPVGPRQVSAKHQGKRDENGEKPTTVRALVLRNGKYGARGTGELALVNKISGREKLDLLAEDLVEKSKKAVLKTFKLEECLKIAKSQFHAYLDDISNLQDPDLFHSCIEAEFKARTPPQKNKGGPDPWRNASYIASLIATRIHNLYMLASAWKMIAETLQKLEKDGLRDRNAQAQLKSDEGLRSQFLALYDMVEVLVDASQNKFSVLATTTPHYLRYFKSVPGADLDEPEVVFDWDGTRDAYKSFLDSIIIELCFPLETYPKEILYRILHEAVEESPKEAKRFPQALWDAVGDLSVTVELQTALETLFLGPDGNALKNLSREMPEQYEQWLDAHIYSKSAADKHKSFKDIVYPLDKTKNKQVLDNLWKAINTNYESVSGMDIDTLWKLKSSFNRTPHWHAAYAPHLVHDDSDSDSARALVPVRKGKKEQKRRLAITDGAGSDDSMPELQSVSDSSDEEDSDEESDDDFFKDVDDYEEDSEYDTDQEDETREMLREAMDIAASVPEFYNPAHAKVPEFDEMAEERKGNPFIKLLGSLRGRMFSSSSKLKTGTRTEPRNPHSGFTTARSAAYDPDEMPPLEPISRKTQAQKPTPQGSTTSRKATVEEVEDEDDDVSQTSKKKKKKPKKKKKKPAAADTSESVLPPIQEVPRPQTPPPLPPASASPSPAPASSPAKKQPPATPKSPSARAPSISSAYTSASTLTLPVEQTTAQSARSYLQSENIEAPKTKVKSRPDHGSLFSRGFLSKSSGKEKAKPKKTEAEMEKDNKRSWFSKLGKKTNAYMHQLLNTSEDSTKGIKPMKWEHFLKVMREMGFEYDPSTAGSSVRFDPPDKRDRSITFHKPHPDPTLFPVKLKEFSKKLQDYYGWNEEDFFKATKS